ncbi:MAG TPA: M28 family peptidase [Solirubrobacteraceae bacterium]|nr:M28 family peptidase [Solirubrobacteraceae bacterium]
MLDPRIYRTSLIVVAVAVIVVAFSLGSQPNPLNANLVPDAFNGGTAYATMGNLAAQYPARRPGSDADNSIADYVASNFSRDGLQVQRTAFSAQTIDGPRMIQTVTGTLAGLTPGSIVVVAHRDSSHVGAASDLSGTAVLLELAQVLSSQSQQRSIVLASTSAQVGAAGAAELARSLPGPVDAVIVLGDMAGTVVRTPLVVPWSDSTLVAPPLLRKTVESAIQQQTTLAAGEESIGGQFLHLAFPLAASEQRPFAAYGQPAVLVSTSGSRVPAPDEKTSEYQISGFGRAVLQSVSALEPSTSVPAPSSYMLWSGKVIPSWAVRLLVLALILPVLIATIDGIARARRQGARVGRWTLWVLAWCLPFVLAVLVVLGLRLTGAINIAPPGPIDGSVLTLGGRAAAILIGLGILIVLGLVAVWWGGRRMWSGRAAAEATNGHSRRRQRAPDDAASSGAAAALMLVLCAVTLALWLANPFAAGLMVVALHCWLWIVGPEDRLRAPWAVLLLVAGLVPGILAALYYTMVLGLGLAPAAWNAVLMLAGGDYSAMAALEWSIVLGCVISLALMMVRIARQPRAADATVTIRGPVTYAGPGSLGSTQPTIRR